jgi:hypothetical protein
MEIIPKELIDYIFVFIPCYNLSLIRRTCKQFNDIINSKNIPRHLLKFHYSLNKKNNDFAFFDFIKKHFVISKEDELFMLFEYEQYNLFQKQNASDYQIWMIYNYYFDSDIKINNLKDLMDSNFKISISNLIRFLDKIDSPTKRYNFLYLVFLCIHYKKNILAKLCRETDKFIESVSSINEYQKNAAHDICWICLSYAS